MTHEYYKLHFFVFQLRTLQLELLEKQTKLEDVEKTLEMFHQQWRLIRQEIKAQQDLLRANQNQFETEKHLTQMEQSETDRMLQDMKRMKKQIANLESSCDQKESTLKFLKKQLEEKEILQKNDHGAFDEHLERLLVTDDYYVDMAKNLIIDEKQLAELDLKLRKLNDEKQTKLRKFQAMETELKASEVKMKLKFFLNARK